MRLSHKIFAFTFVIAVATLAAVAVHTVDQTTRLLIEQSIDSAKRQADREAFILTEHVDAAKSDALLLANVDAARRLSEATSEDDKATYGAELERVFQTVMAEKPYYTQVRLIGIADQGRELVRVNQDKNGISPVPVDRLQSKADRYYYQETVSLGENQTYVSKLDLNREHGRIVEPHQPVLRISTTVFSSRGDLVAIIVINIDMNVLLGDIVVAGPGGFPVLTDCGGEFLYHPDSSRTYAFEFGRQDRIQDEYAIEQEWVEWMRDPGNPSVFSFASNTDIVSVARVDFPGAWDEEDGFRTFVIGNVLPQTLIRKSGDDLREHLYITLLGICAFLGVAIGGATAFLTRPVTLLTRTADKIAVGAQGVEVSVASNDEIGTLAKALKRMIQSLEEAARTKELAVVGRMAAMVAHDLRNALSSVKVNLHTLESSCRHPGHQRELQWGLANDQIGYMEAVLSDMLTFARPEEPDFDWQDMTSILSAAAISVELRAADKRVEIGPVSLPPLPAVWGDRTQLIRLFRNLIENAVQALEPGGSIQFTARVAASDLGTEVVIEVADDGEGIPTEKQELLFEPFFTTRTTGTGLGLAIVKRIVDQHRGRVDFHTRLGEGTVFLIALPTEPMHPI